MTWAKLDDSFPEHLKVAPLTDRAFRLHVTAICYCARNLTDGEVPKAVLPTLRGTLKLAAELVGAALWDKTNRGSWVVHDFLDYNPSRASVEAERERKRAAGQAGGLASAKARARPSAVGGSGTPDPYPSVSTETDQGEIALPRSRKRRIEPVDISRWEGAHPSLDIPAFVADYLNWTGSSKHQDKIQGFENQLRIGWKCDQFRKPNTPKENGVRYVDDGIFSDENIRRVREEEAVRGD